MALVIEHLVGPPRNDHPILQNRVRERVEREVRGGDQAVLIDCAWNVAFSVWSGCESEERFLAYRPESAAEVARVLYVMCRFGVSLVVVHEPRLYAPSGPWLEVLDRIRSAGSESVLLVVNSFRVKESGMGAYTGFEPWSSLADREEVLDPWA